MPSPPMSDDSSPVTRAQLREELSRYPTREELREELRRYPTREELREELARFVTKDEFGLFVQTVGAQHDKLWKAVEWNAGETKALRAEIEQLVHLSAQRHEELLREIGRTARAAAEEHRRELGVLDDRYRDLPGRVTTLERELEEHRDDDALHSRPRRPRRGR